MTRETELSKRIARGDPDASGMLVDEYYAEILRFCVWHTTDRASAGDACQDTFVKAIRYMDRYSDHGKLRAFLYSVARNACIDIARKNRHTVTSIDTV